MGAKMGARTAAQELKILLILLDYTLNGAKISKFTNTYGVDYTVNAAINSNSNYPLRPFLTCFQFYSNFISSAYAYIITAM